MKKLLVLLIVLGLATSAQAALSLSLSATTVMVGSDVTVSISSDDTDGWTWQFVLSESLTGWSDPVAASYKTSRSSAVEIKAAAGNMASNTPDTLYPAVTQLAADGISVPPSAGVQFIVTLHGEQTGTIYMDLEDYEANSHSTGYLTLDVVPEPMTLALLGLGGLFLRRRR